jgi:hypothetical protein
VQTGVRVAVVITYPILRVQQLKDIYILVLHNRDIPRVTELMAVAKPEVGVALEEQGEEQEQQVPPGVTVVQVD